MKIKTISKKLSDLRMKKGITRAELASMAGISLRAMDSYEQGTRIPRDEVKILLAKCLESSVQSIFFED